MDQFELDALKMIDSYIVRMGLTHRPKLFRSCGMAMNRKTLTLLNSKQLESKQ